MASVLFQRSDKLKCAGDVVIGDNKMITNLFMNVAANMTEFFDYSLMSPVFEWASNIYANKLPKYSSIDPLQVIVWQF